MRHCILHQILALSACGAKIYFYYVLRPNDALLAPKRKNFTDYILNNTRHYIFIILLKRKTKTRYCARPFFGYAYIFNLTP